MSAKQVLPLFAVVLGMLSVGTAPAPAQAAGPAWAIRSIAVPTNFSQTDSEACHEFICDGYQLVVTNVGSAPSSGSLTVRDTLPPGVFVASPESCVAVVGGSMLTCRYGELAPGASYTTAFFVRLGAGVASSVVNFAEVEGGGAPRAVTRPPTTMANTVNGVTAAFGVQDFGVGVFGSGGLPDALAGDHPSLLSTTVNYTTRLNSDASTAEIAALPVQEPKTEIVDLPPGFVADPAAAAQCPESLMQGKEGQCPAASVVGEVEIERGTDEPAPAVLYNVVPEAGYPALFGFEYQGAIFYLRPRVLPSANGYVVSVSVPDITRSVNVKVSGVQITFFGNPTEHDGAGNGLALFTNPDECAAGPLNARLEMDSWVDPERWVSVEAPVYEAGATQAVTGCGAVAFEPTIEVSPEQATADTPSGYEVVMRVPQAPNVVGYQATADLENATITLPAGVSISPSAANGLVACQASGPEGIELGTRDERDSENRVQEGEEMGEDGLVHPAPGHCPAASQIGEVEVVTPLLEHPLKGHVYVAAPACGGEGQPGCTQASATNGELYGLYLEAEGSGVIVKLKGAVSANPATGQLTTTFSENPQLPFSELKLKLTGGERAPLANPQTCGSFKATSDLTPWSAPETPDATPFSSFPVSSGCGAAFSPSFTAGTVSSTAGSYSPFTLTFSRNDGEQDLSGLSVGMPEGLIGKIAGFAQCGEAEVKAAEANTGGCPSTSKVGTATAAAGAGSDPLYQAGPVYLTGPYNGAPFGLAVVVPANAGPFHLGDVVVRAAIHINPSTAAVTVVSNPLPQMIDGVPLRVKTVNVTVGEAGDFTFNPTSCNQMSIGATISSAQGADAGVSSGFQATGCANLPFKPVLSASTVGKASKAGGASLDVKVTSGAGQANIAKVDLQIPKQLSSRLTTLQKACTEAQFAANPAGCPSASDIGSAIVHTPLLNSPLAGPVYLVSHGGAAFPDVEIILQGEGVQLVLDGKTQIKKGITYSHFESVPDAPFTSFETKLPTGKFSIFAANVPAKDDYNLCGQSLSMPIEIVGQNGAVVKQTTKVDVTGCLKAKKATKKKKKVEKKVSKATKRGK